MDAAEPRDAGEAIALWQAEVEDLRAATLARFVIGAAFATGAWLFWIASPWSTSIEPGWAVLVAAAAAVQLAYQTRQRHPRLAGAVLIAGFVAVQALTVWAFSNPLSLALGLVAVVIGVALLQWSGGALVGCVSYASGLWAWQTFSAEGSLSGVAVPLGALYLLTWAAMVIAQHPLAETLQLALTGWFRLQELLALARERRGELSRTLHALEEATYRIERMNSELLLARDQANAARENKQRFAQTVSHELRGPLNLILGFSKLMAMSPERYGDQLPRSYRADMDAIYASSQHIAGLLDDILDLSQIEAERMPLVRERIDLNAAVIRQAVRTVLPLAERKGLSLTAELDPHLPEILGDRVRLRQVLLNLLTNALRFTDSGAITVATVARGGAIQVSVADTGRGIASHELPRLFEEFHQLHLDGDLNARGSGLGLAISRHLIALHGGRIWAESTEGQGTTFFFDLPLQSPSAESPWPSQRATGASSPRSRSVLVVQDDPYTLRIMARYLEGYQVVGIPEGGELLEAIQASHPHAVIAKPEQCAELVAAVAATPYDVPVLGCSMPDAVRGARNADAQAYLMKPVDGSALQATLVRLDLASDARILIADDEPDAVRLIEKLVTGGLSQYRVLRAFGGAEALEVMRDQRPAAVIMDLVMPGMGAEEVMRQMANSPQLAQTPVILVTGQDAHPAGASLGTEITLSSMRPVSAMQGIRRLKALLDVIVPDYVPDEAPGARRPATAPR